MLVFYLSLSLIVSFICSLLEAVILSVTPAYLFSLKNTNPELFQKVKSLKEDIERPLASILTFNTIAHTIGAAGAGAEAQKLFGNEYLTFFSFILTFAILFLSEIIPKSIGATYWKNLLSFSMRCLGPMVLISFPVVWISERVSRLIKKEKDKVSSDELTAIAELSFNEGTLQKTEFHGIKNLIKLRSQKIFEITRDRSQVTGISIRLDLDEASKELRKNTFSRIIVFGLNQNDVKGYVLRSDLQQAIIDKSSFTIQDILKPILIVSSDTSLSKLFHRLLERREHICAVINEDGEFIGIVSLEDIFEKILNLEIFDEQDL